MTKNSQYKSLTEWQKANPSAYAAAHKKGLLEKICEHFEWSRKKPIGYWTLETCKAEALKYKTRNEWRNSKLGYNSAAKNGWINECCSHMEENRKPSGYWTLETCKAEALKYKTRNDWKKNRLGYDAALLNGWMDECCSHMERFFKPSGYWTLETCKEDALKYNTRNEWKKNNGHVYQLARENGWLEECCSHMERIVYPKGYWTLEKCKEDALKYNKKAEWRSSSSGYDAAVRNGWYEECCKHMVSGYKEEQLKRNEKRNAKRKV